MAQGDGTVIHGVRVPLVLPVLGERRNKPSQRRRRGRPSPHRREQDGGCLSARQSPREAARDDGRMGRLLRRQNVMSRYTRAWRHLLRPIGRASCRERVCQYVSISVVAVSLKKKKGNVRDRLAQ